MPAKVTLVCAECATPFECDKWQVRAAGRKYCSKQCSAIASRGKPKVRRRRGYGISANGYRLLFIGGEQVYEHRHVVSKHIGRTLRGDEEVHHVNGNRLDNKIENLRLVTRAEHMKIHAHGNPWSRKYPACKKCGTTERKHNCWGLCTRCYNIEYKKRQTSSS